MHAFDDPNLGLSPTHTVLAFNPPKDSKPRPDVPVSNNYQGGVLFVLGELSGYRPRIFIPTDVPRGANSHDALRDDVLRASGYEPGGNRRLLPEATWGSHASRPLPEHLKGGKTVKGPGIYRKIGLGAYQRSAHYKNYNKAQGLTLFVVGDRGWALTEAGVAVAARYRHHFAQPGDRNVTTLWLNARLNEGLYDDMYRHLLYEARLSRENMSGEIVDNLHGYFTVAMIRDAFRTWLERGDAPTRSQLCEWATRKGISEMRKYSRDALQRQMRGALTSKERNEGGTPMTAAVIASEFQMVLQNIDEDNPERGERVLVDQGAADRAYHSLAWHEGMERVREAIRRHKPGAADRYTEVWDEMCAGTPVKKLGESQGVSRNRAASLMADTRAAVRAAAQASLDAKAILEYITSEPFATMEDIQEDLALNCRLGWLLDELVTRGRLRRTNGSYAITDKGEAYLNEWALQPELQGNFGLRVSL